MTIPDNLEVYIWLSIQKKLRDGLTAASITAPIQYPGVRSDPGPGDKSWIDIAPLTDGRQPSRMNTYIAFPMFQIGCFARFAESQTDGQSLTPWQLAAAVRKIFEDGRVEVKSYTLPSPQDVGCLTVGIGDSQYLDERQIRQSSSAESPVMPANIHAVSLTFHCTLTVY